MALKDNLKALREARGLTQEELAEKAKLHRVTIAELETGRGGDSKMSTLSRLAAALGCTSDELVAAGKKSAPRKPVRQ